METIGGKGSQGINSKGSDKQGKQKGKNGGIACVNQAQNEKTVEDNGEIIAPARHKGGPRQKRAHKSALSVEQLPYMPEKMG